MVKVFSMKEDRKEIEAIEGKFDVYKFYIADILLVVYTFILLIFTEYIIEKCYSFF